MGSSPDAKIAWGIDFGDPENTSEGFDWEEFGVDHHEVEENMMPGLFGFTEEPPKVPGGMDADARRQCEAAWCRLPAGHRSLHDIPTGKPEFSYHGREPLYDAADGCGHDRPQEPDTEWSADDEAWQEFDAWTEDHQPSTSEDGELICLLSPGGFYCPACSLVSKDRGNDEYVECEVAADA